MNVETVGLGVITRRESAAAAAGVWRRVGEEEAGPTQQQFNQWDVTSGKAQKWRPTLGGTLVLLLTRSRLHLFFQRSAISNQKSFFRACRTQHRGSFLKT